jgi:hypothetical protein
MLMSNTTKSFNTALGAGALAANTGTENTSTGAGALLGNTGDDNTANGAFALVSNTTGTGNTAVGDRALQNNMVGSGHTAVGSQALMHANATAFLGSDTAVGASALAADTSGDSNTAVGGGALALVTTGGGYTAVGNLAGAAVTGDNNIAIGSGAGINTTSAHDSICIGIAGNNADNACYIGQIFSANVGMTGTAVFVNSNGRLGTVASSRRFKEEIKPMGKASEAIMALKPVTFRYHKEIDTAGTTQFGLVAEDVEKVNPDLVVRDEKGKPYSVRYDQVNAMLLNEFLKEHKKVEEQQANIAELKSTVGVLSAQLKEQAEQIQKVSAQLKVSKPTPQVVANQQ